jgi:hypothetical protein
MEGLWLVEITIKLYYLVQALFLFLDSMAVHHFSCHLNRVTGNFLTYEI